MLLVAHTQNVLDHLLLQLPEDINYVKVVSHKDLLSCPEKIKPRCSTATRFESMQQLS